MNKKRIQVSLVDDDAGTREKLKVILNAAATISCLHTYGSGEEAVREIPRDPPDVVLMDINLPGIKLFFRLPPIRFHHRESGEPDRLP